LVELLFSGFLKSDFAKFSPNKAKGPLKGAFSKMAPLKKVRAFHTAHLSLSLKTSDAFQAPCPTSQLFRVAR